MNQYNDTKCGYQTATVTQNIACANATSFLCMYGQPTTAPTALPTTAAPITSLAPTRIPTSDKSSAPSQSRAPTAAPTTRQPTSLPTVNLEGYYTVRSYFLTAGSCTGDYQSTIYTINQCYPESFTRSFRYANIHGVDMGNFNITQSFYNNGNCTGQPRAVQKTSFDPTSCNLTGTTPTSYLYTTSFPPTAGGLLQS